MNTTLIRGACAAMFALATVTASATALAMPPLVDNPASVAVAAEPESGSSLGSGSAEVIVEDVLNALLRGCPGSAKCA
ncbi:hypothetical protein [Nocardia asteroides]|uniref:hypothetical protein n=1 Tax=Nocardia asteroides TaxID=1824 RepID=UPI0033CA3B08